MNVAVENEIYEESAVEVTDDAIGVTVDRVEDQVDVEETDIPEDAAGNEPVCGAHPDCHAWKGGRCMLLRIQILAHGTARFTRTKTRMSGSSRTRWSGS